MTDIFSFELKRKISHLVSIILPIIYLNSSKNMIVTLLVLLTSIEVIMDISRRYSPKINNLVLKLFSGVMRKGEREGTELFSGATYMFIGLLISAIFFPPALAITSWFIMSISDSVAALVGKKYGTNKIISNKTLEGTLAFFASSVIISMIVLYFVHYNTSLLIILISCLTATLAELYSKKIIGIDDNLSIPLSYCLSTSLANYFG